MLRWTGILIGTDTKPQRKGPQTEHDARQWANVYAQMNIGTCVFAEPGGVSLEMIKGREVWRVPLAFHHKEPSGFCYIDRETGKTWWKK